MVNNIDEYIKENFEKKRICKDFVPAEDKKSTPKDLSEAFQVGYMFGLLENIMRKKEDAQ